MNADDYITCNGMMQKMKAENYSNVRKEQIFTEIQNLYLKKQIKDQDLLDVHKGLTKIFKYNLQASISVFI